MNFSTQRVINDWTREVEVEMCDLIERGVPPFDAVEQARKNVQKRRAAKVQVSTRDVLALTPYKPLFGHPSGKRGGTHWMTFLKPKDSDHD